MEDKDHLKELLWTIDEVNEPIDLEGVILKAIQQQESSKLQIARYRANGIKALIASGILIIVLGILFSLPSSVRSVEHSIVTYTSIILVLIVLFIQLEMASTKKFNHLKNNLL
jgi:protein-S-isoprenylcysteine O-methyltransferase Ste14